MGYMVKPGDVVILTAVLTPEKKIYFIKQKKLYTALDEGQEFRNVLEL
jgi:hypothetical protein